MLCHDRVVRRTPESTETDLRARFEKYSSVASVLAIVLVIVVIAGLLVQGYVRRSWQQKQSQAAQQTALASIPRINLSEHQKTLVLLLNVDCGFCSRSLPFYQRVMQTTAVNGNGTQIIALFPNAESEVSTYIARNKLTCRYLHGVDFSKFRVSGTPTILLADKDGKIVRSWEGQLPTDQEDEVLQAIN
jgi:thioredoxin-related protein